MGSLKTLVAAQAVVATLCCPVSASADVLWTFAGCAGRLSAQMEHQWLISDPLADRTKQQRAAMISLLEATMTAEQGRAVLARRIDAKHAQAMLLTRATFNEDAADANWALRRANQEIASCLGMLLS